MSVERLATAIKYAVFSEKATNLRAHNIMAFVVDKRTNKVELAEAARLALDSEVISVNIVNIKGKTKNRGNRKGRRSDVKKAYIKFANLDGLNSNVEGAI